MDASDQKDDTPNNSAEIQQPEVDNQSNPAEDVSQPGEGADNSQLAWRNPEYRSNAPRRHFRNARTDPRSPHESPLWWRQVETRAAMPDRTRGQIHHGSVNQLTPSWRQPMCPSPYARMMQPAGVPEYPQGRAVSQPTLAWRHEWPAASVPARYAIPRYASLPTLAEPLAQPAQNQPVASSSSSTGDAPSPPPPAIAEPLHYVDIPVLTGSISQLHQWFDTIPLGSLFEVTGHLVGLIMANPNGPPGPGNEMNYILRDRRESGPIIQVIQPYQINFQLIHPLEHGLLVRCIGRILSKQRILGFKLNVISENEESEFDRVEHVCRNR